ncbi:centromere protein P [Cynoglossus semilaevis]|uniref:centromere protein P n=1 Tax=Cynoglossus semilaevis TaxID=244447 RepID=UPI0004977943|nr:centromere protein P [Cynoglossus semilaevis]
MNKENSEDVKVLEAQIERLREELVELERQKQNNYKDMTFSFTGEMQNALSFVCGQTQGRRKEVVMSQLEEEVNKMEEGLRRQTQMNGINLDSCITKTLQRSENKCIQQLCISGHCSEQEFQVEFQLSEEKQGDSSVRTVSDLNIVMDTTDHQSFKNFMSGAKENNDLLLFFRTLRTYLERCNDRCRTFQHFQKKYPSVVSLPGGCRSEVMSLSHPQLPGLVMFIHWLVDVSKEGKVTSKMDLLTKIPERALQLFPSQALSGTTEAFQSLLRILGPEAAVESVIGAISLSEDT